MTTEQAEVKPSRVEVRIDPAGADVGHVYLDGRRIGTAPVAFLKSGRVLAGNPTCDTVADAKELGDVIKADEAGGWAPEVFVSVDAPDLYRGPLERGVR